MKKLPTIKELESLELSDSEKSNTLIALLNCEPPKKWLKIKDGIWHLPVDKVRFLLSKIFIDWNLEIKTHAVIANSVSVVVTLHYQCPLTKKWKKTDGIGAAPINTKKGAGALDFNQIVHDSVHKCVGAAESFALKNAAKKLGRIFGAEIMTDDKVDYSGLAPDFDKNNAKITEK